MYILLIFKNSFALITLVCYNKWVLCTSRCTTTRRRYLPNVINTFSLTSEIILTFDNLLCLELSIAQSLISDSEYNLLCFLS